MSSSTSCPPRPPRPRPPRPCLQQALCQLPNSVCTAGPQPGTFRAQCAPLDLNLGPSQLSGECLAIILWLSNVPDTKLTWSQAMGTRHAISPRQNHQESPHTNTVFYNTGSTRWWMLQHNLYARTLIALAHQSGSNVSFLAVIENLIFLQHIWMAVQQQHTLRNL